jgi:hypothetical protein
MPTLRYDGRDYKVPGFAVANLRDEITKLTNRGEYGWLTIHSERQILIGPGVSVAFDEADPDEITSPGGA